MSRNAHGVLMSLLANYRRAKGITDEIRLMLFVPFLLLCGVYAGWIIRNSKWAGII